MASPRWIVLKFGGTSVSTLPRWETIARIIRDRLAEGLRPVVVCSALSGISNALDRLLAEAMAGRGEAALEGIRKPHLELGRAMGWTLKPCCALTLKSWSASRWAQRCCAR
ncbi:amino acid kinase family protein [Rhodothermus marinus]|uniref:amino acid kinase family protein n=1 Tax=Rhodothermus marinus TaxID=29549 RepID=UPI000B1BD35C|nr:hypothetical protein [Rhodothermus marinus]